MDDDVLTYKGADRDTLIGTVRHAVAILANKDLEEVKPDEDGDLLLTGDSAAVSISVETEPSAIVFRTALLSGIKESPALYALINEINADIAIGQIYFYEENQDIRYYYKYPAENPSPELVATLLSEMLGQADFYDDRLKVRLGGERFNEQADDEIDI
jgi:hypothetical protein